MAPAQGREIISMTADYSQCHCGDRQQLLIYRYKQRPSHHAGAVIHLEGPHYHPDIPTGIRMHVILRGPRQRQKRRPQRPQSRGLGAAVCDSCLHSTCAPPASTQHNTRANTVAAGHYVIRRMLTCCEKGKSTFFCTFCGSEERGLCLRELFAAARSVRCASFMPSEITSAHQCSHAVLQYMLLRSANTVLIAHVRTRAFDIPCHSQHRAQGSRQQRQGRQHQQQLPPLGCCIAAWGLRTQCA
jgi:hypothetical protein